MEFECYSDFYSCFDDEETKQMTEMIYVPMTQFKNLKSLCKRRMHFTDKSKHVKVLHLLFGKKNKPIVVNVENQKYMIGWIEGYRRVRVLVDFTWNTLYKYDTYVEWYTNSALMKYCDSLPASIIPKDTLKF
jgi:hypothetical protein